MVSPTIDPGKSLNRARRESRVRRWWRSPVFLLALTAGLSAFVIQSGELGTADTTVRLQTATWLWTDEPEVSCRRVSRIRHTRTRRQAL